MIALPNQSATYRYCTAIQADGQQPACGEVCKRWDANLWHRTVHVICVSDVCKMGRGCGGGVQDMLWRNVNLDITSTDGYLSWPKHVAAITIPARSGHISVITNSTANSEQYQQRNVCHCAQVQELQLHRLQPLSKHITSSNCTILYWNVTYSWYVGDRAAGDHLRGFWFNRYCAFVKCFTQAEHTVGAMHSYL